ncbi:hypothetical protein BD410DRAFT_168257 [Rickenella mellea]|uniref:Zn(2)-C6 fungal-type domain-containing protein n=1 Tax=Rickenella mellea TaxID=50990 RepID=A0A4Y7PJL6_9AGAM|nr:hypothetical protein BD410DRAFT_168257 [Rickenella mellea]
MQHTAMESTAVTQRIQLIVQASTEDNEPQTKAVTRNSRPCSACSLLHRRCNISPPFSNLLCQRCSKKGFAKCPPHVSRTILVERRAQEAFQITSDTVSSQSPNHETFDVERVQHANRPSSSEEGLVLLGSCADQSNAISYPHPECGIDLSWHDRECIALANSAQQWYYGVSGLPWLPKQQSPMEYYRI